MLPLIASTPFESCPTGLLIKCHLRRWHFLGSPGYPGWVHLAAANFFVDNVLNEIQFTSMDPAAAVT
jgi:hypothetical protein